MTDAPPAGAAVPSIALVPYLALGAMLRAAEVVLGVGQQLAFTRALACVDTTSRDDLYWAGHCCLVSRSADLATYDRVFADWYDDWFGDHRRDLLTVSGHPPTGRGVAGTQVRATATVATRSRTDDDAVGLVASSHETLRHKDFAVCSTEELAEILRLMSRLSLTTPRRRSRRDQRAPSGRRPDLRLALRDVVHAETRPQRLRWRQPRLRHRPLLLVLDVSGSMSAYSRVLLQFAWSARRASSRVEVFCFGTRLTRVTTTLAHRSPDDALREAAAAVVDWDGGTRIGDSLRELLRVHSRRPGCRGAVTVVCSDGLDRGDPLVLAAQMARLRRLSHRVVWVNPLSADPRFEPVTRGMTAALPHVDALVAGHSLDSLAALSRVVSELI